MSNEKFEIKPNSGFIFRNRKKTEEKHPDYTGTINFDGQEKRVALWVKQGKKEKFFSVKISEYNQGEKQQDDLPF